MMHSCMDQYATKRVGTMQSKVHNLSRGKPQSTSASCLRVENMNKMFDVIPI